jgi:predicted ribosomally synthesized peptide with nif11-like leader
MSIQDTKACMKKIVLEPSFAEKFVNIKSEEEFFSLVKDAGFDFTMEEWQWVQKGVEAQARAYAKENNIEIPDELTDEQLEAVAGGGGTATMLGLFGAPLGSILGAAGCAAFGAAVAGPAGAAVGGAFGSFGGAAAGAVVGGTIGLWIEGVDESKRV